MSERMSERIDNTDDEKSPLRLVMYDAQGGDFTLWFDGTQPSAKDLQRQVFYAARRTSAVVGQPSLCPSYPPPNTSMEICNISPVEMADALNEAGVNGGFVDRIRRLSPSRALG